MKLNGLDGVEYIGKEFSTKTGRKSQEGSRKKAIENLKQGKRWEAQ